MSKTGEWKALPLHPAATLDLLDHLKCVLVSLLFPLNSFWQLVSEILDKTEAELRSRIEELKIK